jgi:hypothetical protein
MKVESWLHLEIELRWNLTTKDREAAEVLREQRSSPEKSSKGGMTGERRVRVKVKCRRRES